MALRTELYLEFLSLILQCLTEYTRLSHATEKGERSLGVGQISAAAIISPNCPDITVSCAIYHPERHASVYCGRESRSDGNSCE
jgi:hypothetical protein